MRIWYKKAVACAEPQNRVCVADWNTSATLKKPRPEWNGNPRAQKAKAGNTWELMLPVKGEAPMAFLVIFDNKRSRSTRDAHMFVTSSTENFLGHVAYIRLGKQTSATIYLTGIDQSGDFTKTRRKLILK